MLVGASDTTSDKPTSIKHGGAMGGTNGKVASIVARRERGADSEIGKTQKTPTSSQNP